MRPIRSARRSAASLLAASFLLVGTTTPAAAADWLPEFDWEGSTAQNVTASTLDVALVRPLATTRVIVGALAFVPTALMAAPMGREGIDSAYEVLIELPAEFAFKREIGEF